MTQIFGDTFNKQIIGMIVKNSSTEILSLEVCLKAKSITNGIIIIFFISDEPDSLNMNTCSL